MLRLKKGIIVSMAVVMLLSSTMASSIMAKDNNISGKTLVNDKNVVHNTYKVDKNKSAEKVEVEEDDDEDDATTPGAIDLDDKSTTSSSIKLKVQEIKSEINDLKQQIKDKRKEIKAEIKSRYTSEELKKLEKAGEKIKKAHKNIAVLPVENIIVKGSNVKFDTPPVIKSGRTLIPVKALSEAFGAKVEWKAAERKVIITKGDTKIILTLDSNKIYVNGVESTIDVPACSLNGRTVVPLKFIVEKLGLSVKWDKDTQDIEIENPTTGTPTTTTGSAIVVSNN